jgi:hypothetical protein
MREWLGAAWYIYIWLGAAVAIFSSNQHGELRLMGINITGFYFLAYVVPVLLFVVYKYVLWPVRWLIGLGRRAYENHRNQAMG